MELTHTYTLWPTLYDTTTPTTVTEPWPDIVSRLSVHARTPTKGAGSGLGPYTLLPGAQTRTDASVAAVTLAVFDVDVGTPADIDTCRGLLADVGVAQHWYTTWSHSPERPAWRLVIPLAVPVSPSRWPSARRWALSRFGIPADADKCSSPGHFYFLPACAPDAIPELFTRAGNPLAVPLLPGTQRRIRPLEIDDDAPCTPEDVAQVRAAIESRHHAMLRNLDPRAVYLERALAGLELAPHGGRDLAIRTLTGVVAYAVAPALPYSSLATFLKPALDATAPDEDKPYRLLRGAMGSRAASDARARDIDRVLEDRIRAVRASYRP